MQYILIWLKKRFAIGLIATDLLGRDMPNVIANYMELADSYFSNSMLVA